MKIKCDSCGAKYQIADDKVKHRIFKIRCKRCENVIVVHTDDGADDPTLAVSAMSEQAIEEDQEATKQVQHDQATVRADQQEAGEDDAVWHIVVDREQVGPITPQDVAGYLGRGEITGDAFVWREGMGDWSKLSTLDTFSHLFAGNSPAEPESKDDDSPRGNPFAAASPADDFGHEDAGADDDVMMSDGAEAADEPGMFAGVDAQARQMEELAAEAGGHLANQRNENSVLFSLDDLESQNSRSGTVTNTGGTDASGLIDISLLGGAPSPSGGNGATGVGSGVLPSTPVAVPQSMPSLVTRKRSNTGLIVGLSIGGLVLAAGIGVAVYMALAPDKKDSAALSKNEEAASKAKPVKLTIGGAPSAKPTPTPAVAGTQPPNQPDTKAAPVTDQGKAEEAPNAAAATEAPKQDETTKVAKVAKPKRSKVKKRRRGRSGERSRSRSSKRSSSKPKASAAQPKPRTPKPVAAARPKPKKRNSGKKDELDDLLSGVGGTGAKRPKPKPRPSGARPSAPSRPAASDNPLLPEKLSRRQVLSVVRKNARSIADCKRENPDLTGTVMVDITIAGSGRVQRAKVVTGKFGGTRVGSCVESRVRSFRFPRFGGAVMKLKIPFGIR